MNGLSVCLLVLLLVIAGCEASKFKELYPDYKSLKFNDGQSKASKWKEDQTKAHEDEIINNPAQGQPIHHTEDKSEQKPLPVEAEFFGYVCTIVLGAALAYIQIRKTNNIAHVQHKSKVVPQTKEISQSETTEEEELEALKEIEEQEAKMQDEGGIMGSGVKKEEEEKVKEKEEKDEDRYEDEGPPMSPMSKKLMKEEKKAESEKPREQGLEQGEAQVVTPENSDEDWIVVNRDGTTDKRSKRTSDSTSSTPSKHSDSDSSKSDIEQDELAMTSYKPGDTGLGDLTTMLERLQIRPDPTTPMKERLQMAKLIQNERKLLLQQAQFTSSQSLKRRSLELQKRKEERREIKELARQDSLREEMFQQQLRKEDNHKKIILHVSVLIMVAIWIRVMEFNLFTLPFLTPPASSSYFSFLPTSLTVMYNLASWANAMRLLYCFFLFVISIVLWKTVSSLAPFVVLIVVLTHAWTSLFRGGIYFGFLFLFTSLSFTLARKVELLRKFPTVKYSILYGINCALAAIVGGIVAHGDPLNPYRIHFFPDVFVEQLFSFLY